MRFKDYLERDLTVFINPDEFGEEHDIDGRTLTVTVDSERLIERSQKEYGGAYIGEILYFVKSAEYGELPEIDGKQIFDGEIYTVFDAKSSMGMHEIILRSNRV